MVVTATIGTSPTMLYFGQDVGEAGAEEPGFGDPTRTSIYDYIGVPHHQRWMNDGKFDGATLTPEEMELREFYSTLLNFTKSSEALTGAYREIHSHNRGHTEWYNDRVFSYVRWNGDDRLLIVCNFDAADTFGFELKVPAEIVNAWGLEDGEYSLEDQLSDQSLKLIIAEGSGKARIDLKALQSFLLKLR